MSKLFKNFTKLFSINYNFMDDSYSGISPELIRYFQNEYGSDWRSAIESFAVQKGMKK